MKHGFSYVLFPTKEPGIVAMNIKSVTERFEIEKICQTALFLSKVQDNGILFIFPLKVVSTKTQGKKLLTLLRMDCSYLQFLA